MMSDLRTNTDFQTIEAGMTQKSVRREALRLAVACGRPELRHEFLAFLTGEDDKSVWASLEAGLKRAS